MASEQCEHRNKFCFVCGKFTPANVNKDYGRKMSETVEKEYEAYFKIDIVKAWYEPEIVCTPCRTKLVNKLGKAKSKYVLPMQWLHRTEHSPNACYFCLNNKKAYGFFSYYRRQKAS